MFEGTSSQPECATRGSSKDSRESTRTGRTGNLRTGTTYVYLLDTEGYEGIRGSKTRKEILQGKVQLVVSKAKR